MKIFKTFLLPVFAMAVVPQSSDASLLVGFSSFENATSDNAPDYAYSGFTGGTTYSARTATLGDQDKFYGPDSLANGGVATGQVTAAQLENGRINSANGATFVVTNTLASAGSYSLTSLLFDLGKVSTGTGSVLSSLTYSLQSANGATTYSSGSLTPYTSGAFSSSTVVPVSVAPTLSNPTGETFRLDGGIVGTPADYHDFIVDLSGLVVEQGQRILFTWGTGGTDVRLDNIALTGALSPIPEPGSLLALGGLVGAGCFLRSRRRPLRGAIA